MNKMLLLLLLFWSFPLNSIMAMDLQSIRDLWHAEDYRKVISELLPHRDTTFGKTIEIDYMLATSFCRHPGDDDLGRAFLHNILLVYELSDDNREKIISELNKCPEEQMPERLAFFSSRSTGGLDAGIRGKMFYFVDGPNRAIGGDPLEVIQKIPPEEIAARIFKLGDGEAAAAAMEQRLLNIGYTPRVYSSEYFIIGSMSEHTDAEMQEIARLLDKALTFYANSYQVRAPDDYISIYLLPDGYQMRIIGSKLHGLKVASGTIGYSFRDDLSVASVVRGPYTGTLKHELTHLLVRTNFGDIPPWLDEGLASLYEVSRFEGDYLRGLPNWRGEVLKRYWRGKPELNELIGMNWEEFDVHHGAMEKQAVHHAMARYWILYLQDNGYLPAVYNVFRTREILQTSDNPVADAERLLLAATGRKLTELESAFNLWLQNSFSPLSSAEIAELQRGLALLGYAPGPVDGLAGNKTIAAVRAFQLDNQLDNDGQIDRELLKKVQAKVEQ